MSRRQSLSTATRGEPRRASFASAMIRRFPGYAVPLLAILGYLLGAYGPGLWRAANAAWFAVDNDTLLARAGGAPLLISTRDCPWCAQARAWLRAHRINHIDCVVDQLPQGRAILAAAGSDRVPQLILSAQRVYGFDPAAYAVALQPPIVVPAGAPSWGCQRVRWG